MKKFITLFKSIVASFLVYIWFLGYSLLGEIGSQEITENRGKVYSSSGFHKKQDTIKDTDLLDSVESYCNSQANPQQSPNANLKINATEQIIIRAKREKVVRDNLIYIPKLDQLWCLVPKAASTSWGHKIIESITPLGPNLEHDVQNASIPVQIILRKYFGSISTKKYKEITKSSRAKKILLTRHPFSRLVSAFEDKLKNRKAKQDSMYFYGRYGVKINRKYRQNRRENKRKEPTFEEFIDYLVETNPDEYDEHWKPISLLCGVCQLNYNVIIKQENLQYSTEKFLLQLGFVNGIQTKTFPEENKTTKEYNNVIQYFKNVSETSILKLMEIFKDDFELFQYAKNLP